MKREVGIKELKNNASKILKQVREKKIELTITLDGEPVAVLGPCSEFKDKDIRKQKRLAVFKQVEEGFEDLNKVWPKDLSAAEAVAKSRR